MPTREFDDRWKEADAFIFIKCNIEFVIPIFTDNGLQRYRAIDCTCIIHEQNERTHLTRVDEWNIFPMYMS